MKPRPRSIRVKPDCSVDEFELGGWLDGRSTYLWFGKGDVCYGHLDGDKLYRLAQAIVRHFEEGD